MLKRATSNLRIGSGLRIIPLNGELANYSLNVEPKYISGFSPYYRPRRTLLTVLTLIADAFKEGYAHKEDLWENDLRTLGIEP